MISCSGRKVADQAEKDEKDKASSKKDQYNKTITDYTEAIQSNLKDANARGELAYYRRGGLYAENGKFDQAIADYTEAIRLYLGEKAPYYQIRLMEAHEARGVSYMKKEEFDKAIADYTEVIQSGGVSTHDLGEAIGLGGFAAVAYCNRGLCYDGKGEHDKALADYKEAIRIEPSLLNDDLRKRMSK
jgi:tetratricopeptide (TPR) repeat protein